MAFTFIGAGGAAQANNASVTPALPTGYGTGDLIVVFGIFRTTTGTFATPSGYTLIKNEQAAGGIAVRLAAFYKVATSGAETAPTLTVSGGNTNHTVIGRCAVWRGEDSASPIDLVASALSTNNDAQDVGPITGLTPGTGDLCLVVFGKADDWTSVATISGDGLTWSNVFQSTSTLGSDAGIAVMAAVDSGGTAVTAKTLAVTGGSPNFPGAGFMFTVNVSSVTRAQPQVISVTTTIGASGPSASASAPTVWRPPTGVVLGANWASTAPDDWGSDAVALLGSGLWTRTTYFPSDTGVWAFTKDPSFALANGQRVNMTVTNVVGNISLNEHNSAYPSDPASYLTNLAAGITTAQPSLVNIENETTLTKYWTDSSANLTQLIDLAHTVTYPLGIPLATDGLISGSVVNVVVRLMRDGYTAANGTVVAGDGGTSTTGASGDFWQAARSTGQQYSHTQAGDAQSDRGMEWLNAAIASKAEYLNVHCYWNDGPATATMIRVLGQYSGKPVCCNESTTISLDVLHNQTDAMLFNKLDAIQSSGALCWIASGTFSETENEPMFNHYDGSPPSLAAGGTSWKSYIDARATYGNWLKSSASVNTPTIKVTATPTPAAISATTTINLSLPTTTVLPAGGYINAVVTLPAPTVTGRAVATPSAISATTTIGAVGSPGGEVFATPDAIAATATLSTPTVVALQKATPDAITATVTMSSEEPFVSSPFGFNGTQSVSGSTTITSADDGFLIKVTVGDSHVTQTIPAANGFDGGFRVTFKKVDDTDGHLVIDFSGTETGDGEETVVLEHQYDSVSLVTDGVAWYKTAKIGAFV